LKYLLLLLALIAAPAFATNLTLTWVAPTTYADGTTPIPAGTAIAYNVYGANQGSTLALLTTTPITGLTNVRSNVNPGTICYAVTAIINAVESAQTSPVCVTVPQAPGAPGGLTVTPTTSSTIAYMLVPGKDTYGVLIVGSVPLGTPCLVGEPVLNYFVVPSASVTFTTGIKPPVVIANCS
jgi:hypothetical protein